MTQSEPLARTDSWIRWAWASVAAGILLAVSTGGPDFGRYSDWATAVLSGDIFALRGDEQSPAGVPYSLWAAAPGVLFALASLVLGGTVDLFIASLATGWLAAIAFWCASFVALRRVADGDRTLVVFGLGALFVGTHAGYYSHIYSTEVFAIAFVALLWALAWRRTPWALVDAVAAGSLTALLILVRPFLAVYAMPALWTGLMSGRTDQAGRASGTQGTWTRPAALAIAVALPILAALAQHAVVNRWMTGSPWQSPYSFEGAGFRSVDLANPEFMAVLTHSWHGLLTYHPLFGVAFVALLANLRRADRVVWGATLVAVVVHLWVQAAWYVWWLGTDTFGMRGMAPAALPLVSALVVAIRRAAQRGGFGASLWTGAAMLACAWSMSLLVAGRTQFLSWADLLSSDHHRVTALVAGLVVGVWVFRHLSTPGAGRADARPASAVPGADAGLLAGLAFGYLLLQLVVLEEDRLTRAVLGITGAILVSAGAALVQRLQRPVRRATMAGALRRLGLPAAAIALFCLQSALFARLAVSTERYLASGAPPPRQFRHVGVFPLGEVEDGYAEYLLVDGFDDKKAALRAFLREQGVVRPDDAFLVSRVKEALAADPLLGDVPIDVTSMNGVVQLSSDQTNAEHRARAVEVTASVAGVLKVEDRMR